MIQCQSPKHACVEELSTASYLASDACEITLTLAPNANAGRTYAYSYLRLMPSLSRYANMGSILPPTLVPIR